MAIRLAAALAPVVIVCVSLLFVRWPERVPSGDIVQITHGTGFEGQPSLSPDGHAIAYRCDDSGNGDICVRTIGTDDVVNLTAGSSDDEAEPAFSPHGQSIAFQSSRGIAMVPVGGGSPVRLTGSGTSPAWTPDGRAIVYSDVSGPAGRDASMIPAEGWTIDLETKKRVRISNGDFHQPSVSPRGLRVAYWGRPVDPWNGRRITGARRDLWTIPVDGGTAVRVTNDPAIESSPIWSPDGRHLYYVANRSGSSAIWRIAIDERSGRTTGLPELVPTPYSQPTHVTRSADGRRFAWSDARPVERFVRVAFDADARKTRGAPVEIKAEDIDADDRAVATDVAPAPSSSPQAPGGGAPGGSFPGRWSPDRRFFAGTSSGGVWIYAAETRSYDQLRGGQDPVWLLDGRRLIFASAGRLYIADAVLKISRELLAVPDQYLASPRLSPDNQFLYFNVNGTDSNLWVLTVESRR